MDIRKRINIIIESYINEIGDLKNIIPYEYNKQNDLKYSFTSNVGLVEVEIQDLSDFDGDIKFITKSQIYQNNYRGQTLYNVSFTVDGLDTQAVQTNLGELNRIIKTVVLIIDGFISKIKPFGLFVSGANRESNKLDPDKIKNTLWLSITQNANIPGYRIDTGELIYDGDKFKGFMIYKNKVR